LERAGENGKGCDFGYALASDSCEGVIGVDACTVAASQAITTFAVPNLGGNLAIPSIFSGLAVPLESPRGTNHLAYFKQASCDSCPPFSTVDFEGFGLGYALAGDSCEEVLSVDACTVVASRCDHRFRGSKPRRTPRSAVDLFGFGGCRQLPGLTDRSVYFKPAPYLSPFFSTVNESHPNLGLANVNAQGLCTRNLI